MDQHLTRESPQLSSAIEEDITQAIVGAEDADATTVGSGMNLDAKESVAAWDDEDGVLVLSALAGAAQELESTLIPVPVLPVHSDPR